MKRTGLLVIIIIALLLLLTGTALAQDGAQPLPEGTHKLFLSHVSRYTASLIPGFIRDQGACDAQGNCPGHKGFQSGNTSVWAVGKLFEKAPSDSTFTAARRMNESGTPEITMYAICFEPNCIPGVTFPEVHAASADSNVNQRYQEFVDPSVEPMDEDEFIRKLTKWIDDVQPLNGEDSMVPATFPIQQITLAGMLPICDRKTTAASEGARTVAHFRMTGIIMCWNGAEYIPGIVLRWTGRDWQSDSNFVGRMIEKWAYVISFDDFFKEKASVQFSESYGSVYDAIARTPTDEWELTVPDWGSIGVAAGGTLGAAGAGLSMWMGTRILPAATAAANTVMIFVMPENVICPTYDLGSGKIPLVVCGMAGINQ